MGAAQQVMLTFQGSGTVTSPAGGTLGGASVSRTTAQAVADASPASVAFDSEDRDDG